MGYSNPDSGCRRHPNQKQIPGVCSFCLRERLSRLSSDTNSYKTSNSTFSDSSSLSSSPPDTHRSRRRANPHRRNGSVDVAAPLGFVLHQGLGNGSCHGNADVSGGSGLKKSKSVAWAPRMRRGGANGSGDGKTNGEDEKSGKKIGGGLWKKLIHSTSKKTKGVLMHSVTVKERSQDTNSFRKF